MKTKHSMRMRSALLALLATLPMSAQKATAPHAESVAQTPAVATNPTFLFRTASFSEGWFRGKDGTHWMTTNLGYTEPFRHASLSAGITLPFSSQQTVQGASRPFAAATRLAAGDPQASDVAREKSFFTLGDIVLRGQAIPYLTPKNGVLLTTSLTMPTAGNDVVGDGKWTLTPSIAYAHFWPRLLVAQFFQQRVSFAGSAQRKRINRSDLDLYAVYSSRSQRWWITSDVNLSIDQANHNALPSSATVSYGRGLRKLFGGSLNGSIQAGGGIGSKRPHDATVSIGLSLVGMHHSR